jgi:carbohydrate kinase, pfkB family
MDPRFDRAQGPTIGFAFGHILAMDAIGENGDEAASLSERILALLRIQNSTEKPSFPSMKLQSHRLARLLVHAAQAGSYTSTGGRQAFADAVWNNCSDEQPHCREFQAATLIAAAVSLGLDSPNLRVEDTLVRAIDVAASLETRGEWSPEPDVVATTRRAMNIVSDTNEYAESPLDRLVKQIGAGNTLSQIVPIAFALASRYQDRRVLTTPLRLGAHTDTILSAACIFIGSVRGADFLRTYGARVVEESLQFDRKESTKNILSGRIPYPGDLLGSDGPSHPIALSGPSSFEDTDSGQRTRQCYFEPVNLPVIPRRSSGQPGRVIFLGELLVDQAMHSAEYPKRGGDVWATDLGQSAGGSFNALVAARRMGAEIISLSPIGRGPNASVISRALRSENIIDAGPRLTGVDNGYRLIFTADNGWRLAVSTTTDITPEMTRVWAEAIQAMGPSDVLWIDGSLIDSEEHARALHEAVKGMPEHARVVFDASQNKGFLKGLPHDNVIVSLRASHARGFNGFTRHFADYYPFYEDNDTPEVQASALTILAKRHIVLRTEEGDAYFASPELDDARLVRPMVTRIPAPTPQQPGVLPTADVHSGTLAGCLAVGIPANRATLLANCAAALATPSSLPTRENIELASVQLLRSDLV